MKRIKMFEKFRNGLKKTNEEFRMAETEEAPVVIPRPDTPTIPKPWSPIPTQVPRPGTEESPVGKFSDVMNIFFTELNKIKDTEEGKKMIKNLKDKYGDF